MRIPMLLLFTLISIATTQAQAFEIIRDENKIYLPKNYSKQDQWPLVVLLHGFKVSGNFQKNYFGLGSRINKKGFILFVPGSITDKRGNRIWNAMDYCCNHDQLPVDDVSFLINSINEISSTYKIDKKRIYLLGHSNGGMMAHRLICDHADLFAAAVSLAGSGMRDLSQCKPTSAVSILEIHAENDSIVMYQGMDEKALERRLHKKELYPYSGPEDLVRYPSSLKTMQDWALKNNCDLASAEKLDSRDYTINAMGQETSKILWQKKCKDGSAVEFWSLSSGGHVPRFYPSFQNDVLDFLLSKVKKP